MRYEFHIIDKKRKLWTMIQFWGFPKGLHKTLLSLISTTLDHAELYWRHYRLLISCNGSQKGWNYEKLVYIYSLTSIIVSCLAQKVLSDKTTTEATKGKYDTEFTKWLPSSANRLPRALCTSDRANQMTKRPF